jgi:MerR family transcriptional regulator, copper efflux regulator
MTITIGKLAARADVGVETVRFYERQGLIPEPQRSPKGYRQYREAEVGRIRFIRKAQDLGFTLSEIRELLSLRVDAGSDCGDVRGRAEQKIAQVEEKLADLRRIRSALEELTRACAGTGPTSECPILDAMEGGHLR